MTARLSQATVGTIPVAARPLVTDPNPGILHIGLGAFHRAHQAGFTEEAMATGGGDWGIIAVAPRSADLIGDLRDQDHLFSVASRSAQTVRTQVVGSLVGTRHLPTEADIVLDLFADPTIRVVTLTVTEKAYRLDPITGALRLDDEVRADLAGARPPTTIPGLLVQGLRRRAAAGSPPVAIVSCDNLPGNGARIRALVDEATGGGFGDWVTYPATMVDRIVPASTRSTLDRAATALGVVDLAAVDAEPYRQWVIEDDFPGGRPAWEQAGAVLTTNVTDWERLKLRVLNGVHSTLAYLGALAGCVTIAEAIALPGMTDLLVRLIHDDITPTLTPPAGIRVDTYGASVLERFANPTIEHRTQQVAMDGTQKLPQRIIGTIVDRRRQGAMPGFATLTVAAWMRFAMGTADNGQPLPLQDPLADAIRAALPPDGDPARTVAKLLGLEAVFAPELADDAELAASITDWLSTLGTAGAAATIKEAAR